MALGIDFGTSFTTAACVIGETVAPVTVGYHSTGLMSAAFLPDSGVLLYGQDASRLARTDPGRYVSEIKRDLGEAAPYRLGDLTITPEQVLTGILRLVIDAARAQYKSDAIGHVTLTLPAAFELAGERAALMRRAAAAAGADPATLHLMHEPQAAALGTYAVGTPCGDLREGGQILVYDLGGGTFDTTLLQLTPLGLVPAVRPIGDASLGGRDIDRALVSNVLAQAPPEVRDKLVKPPAEEAGTASRREWISARLKLLHECREAKEALSQAAETSIECPGSATYATSMTRERLEHLVHPLIDRTIACCRQLLELAGSNPGRLAHILLVGGSCRMPCVQSALTAAFSRPLLMAQDPARIVANGAAIDADQRARPEVWERLYRDDPDFPIDPQPTVRERGMLDGMHRAAAEPRRVGPRIIRTMAVKAASSQSQGREGT